MCLIAINVPFLVYELHYMLCKITNCVQHYMGRFCVQCGKSNICSFPCPACPDVLFCSMACLEKARKSHHKYECPMRFYAILKCIAGVKTDSISVGKMLALRIATLYYDDIEKFSTVHVNVKKSSDFDSAYSQLMSLHPASYQPQDQGN